MKSFDFLRKLVLLDLFGKGCKSSVKNTPNVNGSSSNIGIRKKAVKNNVCDKNMMDGIEIYSHQ